MMTQYSLKNKLRVLLMPSHKSPVASVQVWVKTGSADEKKGEEGISHFIEHLVFKGTKKYGVGEIASVVEGSGGELNAYTTFDHTVFHVTISSQFIDVGLDTISQMMGFPTFDPAEIDNEREVVIEEIKRSFDSPSRVSSQQIFSTVFKKHAYGIPVIGYEKIIRKVTPRTLKDYYHRRYVPQNMTVVLAGDLPGDIKNRVNKFFGDFEPFKLAPVKRVKEPKQTSSRTNYKVTEFKETQLNLSFVLPSIEHPDLPAVDVLGMIFGQGDTSRLMQVLRLEKPLVTSVSSGAYNPIDAGLFIAGLSFQASDFKDIGPILNAEFQKLIYEGVTEEELFRAKQKIESDEIFSLETVDGLARKIGTYHVLLNDAKFFEKYLKAIQKLTVKDLQRVAKKYLLPQKLSATLALHKDDASVLKKSDFAKWVKQLEKTLVTKPKVVAKKTDKALKFKLSPLRIGASRAGPEAHTEKITLPTGAHLFIRQNPETPCYSLRAGFLGGSRVEPTELQGLVHALSNTWTTGTKKLSEQQIAEQIESTGASLSAFGGRNSFGLNLDGISKFQKQNLSLFAEVLANPGFVDSFVEREKAVQKENIRSKADYPSSVTIQAFHEEIFSNHPYSRDSLGRLETVDKIESGGIHKYFSKWAAPENLYMVAVGDVDKKLLIEQLTEATKNLNKKAEKVPQFGLSTIPANRTKFMSFDKNQTHIVVGYQGLSIDDPDKPALQIIQSILSGQGGRLFLELRDKASLAYSVSPIEMEGVGAGYFGGYIACSPEKAQKAIAMLRVEFSKLVETPMTSDELAKAKRYLVGRHDIDLQRNSAQASQILFEEIYGLDSEKSFHYEKVLEPVTSKDVQRVANRIFSPDRSEVVVAVGAQDPFI